MANTVYDSETIALEDETEVTLKPLSIGLLRKFMKAWNAFSEVKDEDDAFGVYINCCGIALSKSAGKQFEKPVTEGGELSDEYRDYLEDVLDMDTIFRIFKVCGQIDFEDPKLLEAAEAAVAQASLGTT